MCIFPSDGISRIRFTGLKPQSSTLSRMRPAPRRHKLFRDGYIITACQNLSSHLQRKFLAAQNMEVQVEYGLTGIGTAV